jgi:serine/threonine protein kinase
MELLSHPRTLLAAGTEQSLEGKAELLAQLARALVYLHRRGILHCDIKPSNVLCVVDDVKVLDFGIATKAAKSDTLAGTVEYMAPELFSGEPPSVESDLYSMGVVAHQLLTGKLPHNPQSMSLLLSRMLEPSLPSLTGPDRRTAPLQGSSSKQTTDQVDAKGGETAVLNDLVEQAR